MSYSSFRSCRSCNACSSFRSLGSFVSPGSLSSLSLFIAAAHPVFSFDEVHSVHVFHYSESLWSGLERVWMPSYSSFLCVGELWTVLETGFDSVCSLSSFSSLGSFSSFTSFTLAAHSVFAGDYAHSVHELHFTPNLFAGVSGQGLDAVLVFFLVYLGGLWTVLKAPVWSGSDVFWSA